jgi:hypothetical protein
MRRWLAMLVALGIGALGGCYSSHPERSTARLHAPPLAGLVGDDVIFLDVAVIERPLGDAFVNRDLWREADEQIIRADGGEQAISLERKTALEANGFRVGQVSGQLPPAQLLALLLSPRSCQPHRLQLHAGNETTIPLGPLWPHCRCRLAQDGQITPIDLPKAQCQLKVTPSLTDDGRIHLRFTPHIKYGELKTVFAPLRDAAGVLRWGRQEEQAEELYSWLSWTIAVAPNDYVVLGTPLDKGETLGEQFFLPGEENPGIQRLLVLRTAHVPTPAGPTEAQASRSPPLALRVNMTMARGSAE